MNTEKQIVARIRNALPTPLWDKLHDLSFCEMAARPEAANWACELKQAELDFLSTNHDAQTY